MTLTSVPVAAPLAPAAPRPLRAPDDWLTATVRPTGSFGRDDIRLRALLQPLSAFASLGVVDLGSARLRGTGAAAVIDEAADRLERRGGCLLCVNVDEHNQACLARAGGHAVVVAADAPRPTVAHIGLTASA